MNSFCVLKSLTQCLHENFKFHVNSALKCTFEFQENSKSEFDQK